MKKTCIIIVLVVWAFNSQAQKQKITYYTADSLASGSLKNTFTSFFQLAFDNLTGDKKEFNFSSNPYALLLKGNPDLAIDYNYRRMKPLQRLNFNFGIAVDDKWNFNGFNSGIKYSIIDQRDPTRSPKLFKMIMDDTFSNELSQIRRGVSRYMIDSLKEDTTKRMAFEVERDNFLNGKLPFGQLRPEFKRVVESIIQDKNLSMVNDAIQKSPGSNVQEQMNNNFKKAKEEISNALLWTVGISDTTYKDQFFFSNIVLSSELSKGLTKNTISSLAFTAKSAMNITNDSLISGRDLKRSFLNFQGGLQWVYRTDDYVPLLDLTLAAKYQHLFSGMYAAEKKSTFFISGIVNIRVLDDIWIPIVLDYNPDTGKVTATLNTKFNFQTIRSLVH